MKYFIILTIACSLLPLFLKCGNNEPSMQLVSPPPDSTNPANFVENAFLLLDDCILDKYTGIILHQEDSLVRAELSKLGDFGMLGFIAGNIIYYCAITQGCAKFSIIDSNGVVVKMYESNSACDDTSRYPEGFITGDTLFLQDYILKNWPEGIPEWENSIYVRVGADNVKTRYALPKLCGQYTLIDENGLPAGYFVGIGGCAGYREFVSK